MNNFLTRLTERALGKISLVRPLILPHQDPAIPNMRDEPLMNVRDRSALELNRTGTRPPEQDQMPPEQSHSDKDLSEQDAMHICSAQKTENQSFSDEKPKPDYPTVHTESHSSHFIDPIPRSQSLFSESFFEMHPQVDSSNPNSEEGSVVRPPVDKPNSNSTTSFIPSLENEKYPFTEENIVHERSIPLNDVIIENPVNSGSQYQMSPEQSHSDKDPSEQDVMHANSNSTTSFVPSLEIVNNRIKPSPINQSAPVITEKHVNTSNRNLDESARSIQQMQPVLSGSAKKNTGPINKQWAHPEIETENIEKTRRGMIPISIKPLIKKKQPSNDPVGFSSKQSEEKTISFQENHPFKSTEHRMTVFNPEIHDLDQSHESGSVSPGDPIAPKNSQRIWHSKDQSENQPPALPPVQVTIGRVEVQSIQPPPLPVQNPIKTQRGPKLTLDDYLKKRIEESS